MSKPLTGIIGSQFFACFNEYAMKLMVFTLATRPALMQGGDVHVKATFATLIFLLPVLLFSFPAGILVDRFCKRSVIISVKALEVVLLGTTALCLFVAPTQILYPFIALGMMGVVSALFNPAKGSILPEILCPRSLGRGNGVLEMWTMIALFAGFAVGPLLLAFDRGGLYPHMTWLGFGILTVVALISLLFAYRIPKVESVLSERKGFFKSIKEAVIVSSRDSFLFLLLMGNIFFWVVMTYFGQNVLVETKSLGVSEAWQGVPIAAYWLGIAFGSLGGGKLPTDRILKGPKLAAVGWFFLAWTLFRFLAPGFFGSVLLLVFLGLAAGFLIVPLQALLQARAPKGQRGSVLALSNILNTLGILLGSFLAMHLSSL